MYYILNIKNNILNRIYFLNYIIVLFSIFEEYSFFKSDDYPVSITLLNGNIFTIYKEGISIYNSSISNEIKKIENFTNEEQNNYPNNLQKLTISRFSENDYGYIICIINEKIYIFNWEGEKIKKISCNELKGESYTIVPIKRQEEQLEYMIGFITGNTNITLIFYDYYLNNETNQINSIVSFTNVKLLHNLLSCQLMTNNTEQDEIIVCFIGCEEPRSISSFYIDIKLPEKRIISERASFEYGNSVEVKSMKTNISLDKKKCLVCFSLDSYGYCSIYFVQNNSFSEVKQYKECKNEYHTLNIFYMRENNQYFLACSIVE